MNEEPKHCLSAAEREPWRAAARKFVGPVLGLAFLYFAQVGVSAGQQPLDPMQHRIENPSDGLNAMDPGMARRQLLLLNVQRQRKLVSDTNKLLRLAVELKAEIDAGGASISLSPQQVHRVEEIEKLAKSVKQKMTLTEGEGPPSMGDLFP